MAAGDAPQTLSELRTDILNRLRETTGVSATNTILNRFINDAVIDVHRDPRVHLFPWQIRRAYLQTQPDYSTGTVTVTRGSTSVTGSSTAWTTNNAWGVANVRAGGKIRLGDNQEVYRVSSVDSATTLTLDSLFTGGSALSGASYLYFEDEYALASDFLHSVDLHTFSEERQIFLIGPQEFRRRYPRNDVLGTPKHATIVELGPSGNTTPRPRVVFGPSPTEAETIPYWYVSSHYWVTSGGTRQRFGSNDGDEPVIYPSYRQVIVWHVLWHWFEARKNDDRGQLYKGYYDEAVMRMTAAYRGEDQDRPRLVPRRAPPFGTRLRRPRFDYNNLFDRMAWP